MGKRSSERWTKMTLTALATVLAMSSPAAAGTAVYDQPSDHPGGTGWASQDDPGNVADFTAYDNFTLLSTTLITDAHWQGVYFNPAEQGTITAFTLGFWADAGGQPGAQLLTQTIPGTAGETFVGLAGTFPVYDYDTDLLTPFLAAAGVTYWLSIVPTLTFPPQWGWHTGTGGDGVFVQDTPIPARNVRAGDLAFSLTVPAPEPASLGLLGAGLLGAAALSWYRRRRS